MEEDGKNVQLSTKAAKILQTRAPISVLSLVLHHVLLSCGQCGPTLPRLLAAYVTAATHNWAHVLPCAHLNTSYQSSTCTLDIQQRCY